MKLTDWLFAAFLTICGALFVAIGFKAGKVAPASEIWEQLAAGVTTGFGILVLIAVAVGITKRSRAR